MMFGEKHVPLDLLGIGRVITGGQLVGMDQYTMAMMKNLLFVVLGLGMA